MGFSIIAAIITKDQPVIDSKDIIHFKEEDLTIFPLRTRSMDQVREEIGKYSTVQDLIQNKAMLSKELLQITELIEQTGISNFVIHYHVDVGDSRPFLEFFMLIFRKGQLIRESIASVHGEETDYLSEEILGIDYFDFNFRSFEEARGKYYGWLS